MDFEIHDRAPESKAGLASREAQSLHDELMQMFDAFRDSNDARIAELEKRGASDVISEDKVARINAAIDAAQRRIDELTLKAARPAARPRARRRAGPRSARAQGGVRRLRPLRRERGPARAGAEGDVGRLQSRRRLSGAGGDRARDRPAAYRVSPIRSIAGVREVSASVYKKPFMTSGPTTGWVGETDARTQTGIADACRAHVPGDGALRHAGGDRDAAGRLRRQHRRVDRLRGRADVRRAGRRRVRHRRRHQQADGLSRLYQGRRKLPGPGARSAMSRPASTATFRPRAPSDTWSIWSMRSRPATGRTARS